MTTEQITIESGNKIIAEFMGVKWSPMNPSHARRDYDNDWNYLMPVVEKIENESDEYNFFISGLVCSVQGDNCFLLEEIGDTKIQATWKAVINYITWYNTTLQNK